MKTVYTFAISIMTLVLFSCNSSKLNTSSTEKQDSMAATTSDTTAKRMVGGDQDEHGCKASAGYSWSVLKQECIRPFELTTKLKDLTNSTLAGFLLFAADQKQAEVFASEFNPSIVLTAEGTDIYTSKDQQYKLEKDAQKHWVLLKTTAGKTSPILQQE